MSFVTIVQSRSGAHTFMMSPSWEHFETFLAVMQTGSLSAAARALQVAQPTIRRRVEALEASVGAVLFTRATTGLVPTDAANATLPAAEAMAASARAFARLVSAPNDSDHGTVRVTASQVMGGEVLPDLLEPLLRAKPGLQLELVTSNRFADLLRRDADIAVRMAAPTQASLVAKKVAVIPVGFFASAAYLSRHPPPKTLRALTQHTLVGSDRERGLVQALTQAGLTISPRDFCFRSDDDLVQLAAVRAGVGIGVCQVPLASMRGDLVRVLPQVAVPLETWVVMHEDQRRVQRVRLVFEALVAGLTNYVKSSQPTTDPSKRRSSR